MSPHLLLRFDGSCLGNRRKDPGPAGYGWALYIRDPDSEELTLLAKRADSLHLNQTSNFAEFEGCIQGLRWVAAHAFKLRRRGYTELDVEGDSELVINGATGKWTIRDDNLVGQLERLKREVERVERKMSRDLDYLIDVSFEHIYRKFNKEADKLAKKASKGKHEGMDQTVSWLRWPWG